MRRSTVLFLIATGAAVVGFTIASIVEQTRESKGAPIPSEAASPQVRPLNWHETLGARGQRLAFGVTRFAVVRDGWKARVSISNDSDVAFDVDKAHRSFGVMLFSTGQHDELSKHNDAGTLPAVRPALRYDPPLPDVLDPQKTWSGTMSAHGALAAGTWVRVVFGAFDAIGRAPDIFSSGPLIWITDHTFRLRG